MRSIVLVLFYTLFSLSLTGQSDDNDRNLALQYYNEGEYEKAVNVFENLFEANDYSDYYYRYLLKCHLNLEDYQSAEELAKNQAKRYKENEVYQVDRGHIYSKMGNEKKAEKHFEAAIEDLDANRVSVSRLSNAFIQIKKHDYAVKAFERGREIMPSETFNLELANLYKRIGNATKMSNHFLDYLKNNPGDLEVVQNALQDPIEDKKVYEELQKQLYQRIQNNPDAYYYNELLIWQFLQRKDFENALIQVKALDKRNNESGKRVFKLATQAINLEAYDAAIEALNYLIEKGQSSPYYFYAREAMLNVKKERITSGYSYSREDLSDLKSEYEKFLEDYGQNKRKAASTIKDLAQLEAFYLHNLDEAISLLEDLIDARGLDGNFLASTKLDYGDYLLMRGDIWDATLIYSQVDLDFKDEPLGELARYKNAKLYYYIGDFEYAQGQLEVLKGSTSELIANDALELSVFITSNLGLDTTDTPLRKYAKADLYSYQNKFDRAQALLDSVINIYQSESLMDDVWYLKGEIAVKRQEVNKAVSYFQKIMDQDDDELLKDNALFKMADLYENALEDEEKAQSLYKKLLLEYKDSIFVVEARKRFRRLRGDQL